MIAHGLLLCLLNMHKAAGLPRSAMLYTPAALELALRWPLCSGGDEDKPDTAESTLVRFDVSADMFDIAFLQEDTDAARLELGCMDYMMDQVL